MDATKRSRRSKAAGHRGFSLLELLVVLVIIGIIISVAIAALGDFGLGRRIKVAITEFKNIVPLAEEQAILEPAVYGMTITQKGYGFYRYIKIGNKLQWQAITDDPLLRFRTWPTGSNVTINIEGVTPLPVAGPKIIISSSGDITPFSLEIGAENPSYRIQVESNGTVLLKRIPQ